MNTDVTGDFLTFGFDRKVAVFAVVCWGFCDAMGALLRHTGGILQVESTVLTLALPSPSAVHESILLI